MSRAAATPDCDGCSPGVTSGRQPRRPPLRSQSCRAQRRFRFSALAEPIELESRCAARPMGGATRRRLRHWSAARVAEPAQFAEAADGLVDRGLSVYVLNGAAGSSPSGAATRSLRDLIAAVVALVGSSGGSAGVPSTCSALLRCELALGAALERPGWRTRSSADAWMHIRPDYTPLEKLASRRALLARSGASGFPRMTLFTGSRRARRIAADRLGRDAVCPLLVEVRPLTSSLRRRLAELTVPLLVWRRPRPVVDTQANPLARPMLGRRWRRVASTPNTSCSPTRADAVLARIGLGGRAAPHRRASPSGGRPGWRPSRSAPPSCLPVLLRPCRIEASGPLPMSSSVILSDGTVLR